MTVGSQKEPPLGLSAASDRLEDTAMRTILEQTGAAESFRQERSTPPARLSRSHLYNLIRRGEGPAFFRAGRRVLISFQSAAAWIVRNESMADAKPPRGEKRP